ncbi:hypothetical protein ACD578_28575 (plasmid) [Microvirga sp. RSM25]|uniref:hypothetical protein n=1 Tax=Microvirga sp. RSM25 TaxID=3273802 RepID=UPI00384DDD59
MHLIDELATTKNLDLDARRIAWSCKNSALSPALCGTGMAPRATRFGDTPPALWRGGEANDLAALENLHHLSELVDGSDSDLRRDAMTVVRFWKLADPLPMAVIDPPY